MSAEVENAPTIRGRFAPSPTGDIHLGNVWTALLAWLQVRQAGGTFVLRVEDLDPDRSRSVLARQQIDDLYWLGLDWDEGPNIGGPHAPYVQSRRTEHYAAALDQLVVAGLVYPCYCTRAEVRAAASAPHGPDGHGDYPGACRNLTPGEQQEREARGRRPSLRIHMPDNPTLIHFDDLCQGTITEDLATGTADFVLRRADSVHAYQLAVVVDDGMMGMTHVIRGADLLSSTARQIWLHRLLGYPAPRFGHVPLLLGRDGHRLSKRHAALSIARLRASGARPEQIIGALAYRAGLTSREESAMPHDLIGLLDLGRLPHAPIMIDEQAFL